MANQNVTVVRRFMRRFLEQDVDGALEDVHPDAKLDWSSSDAPDSGVYTGHAAWRAFGNLCTRKRSTRPPPSGRAPSTSSLPASAIVSAGRRT